MKTVQTLEDKALVRIYRKDLTVSLTQSKKNIRIPTSLNPVDWEFVTS